MGTQPERLATRPRERCRESQPTRLGDARARTGPAQRISARRASAGALIVAGHARHLPSDPLREWTQQAQTTPGSARPPNPERRPRRDRRTRARCALDSGPQTQDTAVNLGLRCQAHNAWEADRDYGASRMASKRKRKPWKVREPVARHNVRRRALRDDRYGCPVEFPPLGQPHDPLWVAAPTTLGVVV